MKIRTRTLVAFLISAFSLGGCANRAVSLRMLDQRAEYDDPRSQQSVELREAGISNFEGTSIPTRSRARVATVYIHKHELPSKDYFWGGWVSMVIEEDSWVLTKPGRTPRAKGILNLSGGERPGSMKLRRKSPPPAKASSEPVPPTAPVPQS